MTRLRLALIAFEHAETLHLSAQRNINGQLQRQDANVFWDGPKRRIEATLQASAKEVIVAFGLYSEAGLVVLAIDKHLVTKARRYVAEDREESLWLRGSLTEVQPRR